MTMNASDLRRGMRVIFAHPTYGFPEDAENAARADLVEGETYTIAAFTVNGWNADITLKERPGLVLSHVHFENGETVLTSSDTGVEFADRTEGEHMYFVYVGEGDGNDFAVGLPLDISTGTPIIDDTIVAHNTQDRISTDELVERLRRKIQKFIVPLLTPGDRVGIVIEIGSPSLSPEVREAIDAVIAPPDDGA